MGSLNVNDLVIYDANNSSDIKWIRVDFGTVFSSVFFGNLSHNGLGNANPTVFISDYMLPPGSYVKITADKGDDDILFTKIEDAGSLTIPAGTEVKLEEF